MIYMKYKCSRNLILICLESPGLNSASGFNFYLLNNLMKQTWSFIRVWNFWYIKIREKNYKQTPKIRFSKGRHDQTVWIFKNYAYFEIIFALWKVCYNKFDIESRLKRIKLLMTRYLSTRNFGFLEISGVLYGHCVSKLTLRLLSVYLNNY